MALIQQTTRQSFLDSYQVLSTRSIAQSALRMLDDYLKSKNLTNADFITEMENADQTLRAKEIRRIQDFMQTKITLSSCKKYRGYLIAYLADNGIPINTHQLNVAMRGVQTPLHEDAKTPTRTTIKHIMETINVEDARLFFMIQYVSTMRQGETMALMVDDIDFTKTPVTIHILAENTKTRRERFTFLTNEVSELLKQYILDNKIQGQLFTKAKQTYQFHWSRALKKLGLDEKFTATGRNKMSIHRLRAGGSQKIGDKTNKDIAEILLGHTGGLNTYSVGDHDRLAQNYLKAENSLSILS